MYKLTKKAQNSVTSKGLSESSSLRAMLTKNSDFFAFVEMSLIYLTFK